MVCSIQECDGTVVARGWCTKHYTRWQRHGDPTATTRQPPATAEATEKHCPRCANVKPIDQFGKRPNGKPKGYCRECDAMYQRTHSSSDDGRKQRRQARSKWNDNNHGYFIQYRYGITGKDYDRMLTEQGGGCAICGASSPGGRDKVFAVDHCHDSNVVRGLLCPPCNRGLGQFADDPQRLRLAAAYLESA